MALSVRNVCRQQSQSGLFGAKNKVFNVSSNKTFLRYLRGSRLGKDLNKEETKYRNLLKTLREQSSKSKPVVYHSGNIPVGEVTPLSNNESSECLEKNVTPLENLSKILEERITPIKILTYTRQLEKKYNKSLALLRLFGQKLKSLKVPIALGNDFLPCPVDFTIPSPLVESYRNQDEFSVGLGVDEYSRTVGFLVGKNSGSSTPVCLSPNDLIIIKESHKEFLKDFQNYLKDSPLGIFQVNDDGCWRGLKIRSNITEEIMGIILMHPQQLSVEDLQLQKEKLKEFFSVPGKPYNLKSLFLQTCSQQRFDINEATLDLIFGEPYILEESYNKIRLQISPNSYFMSNTKVMDCVYESFLKLCRVRESTTILDIFCGIGSLSLMVSPHVQRCIGIDSCSSSVNDAKQNALANSRPNVKFFHGNIDYMISELLSQDYHDDIIAVINPSRTELSKTAIKCLRACKYLKKIVYITTKPKTAADHFIRLCKPCGSESYLGKYFVPILAVPFDLSPQTDHFGLIVMFQRL